MIGSWRVRVRVKVSSQLPQGRVTLGATQSGFLRVEWYF
jgi:hypothetical protein